MSSQTRIYFKLKQIALKEGSSEQIKFEIRLNEEVLSISNPFQEYAVFHVKNLNTDQNFKLNFKQTVNNSEMKSTDIDFVFPSTVLSKEREKEKALTFSLGKVSGTANVSVLICNENSQKEKSFLSQFKKASTSAVSNLNNLPRPSNSKSQQGENRSRTNENMEEKSKITEENSKVLDEKLETVSNKSFENEEDDIIKEEPVEKKTMRSEVLRKSLKINYNEFTYNSECKRCNYLERLIQAQNNDIKVLQNQIECFMKGNFDNPKGEIETLESETLLKEPVFNKLFNDVINVNLDESVAQSKAEETKINSNKKPVQKSSSIKATSESKNNSEKEKTKINYQKPGESVDIYVLDDNREKRIQKYEQEIDNLKAQLFAIMKQKKGLEYIKIENESLRTQISRAETIRIQLEEKLIENNNTYQSKLENALNDVSTSLKEKRSVEEKLSNVETNYNNLKTENELNLKRIKELDQKLIVNLANSDQLKNVKETITSLREEFSKQEKSKILYQEDFRKNLAEMNNKLDDLKKENNKLFNENNLLSTKIRDLESTVHSKSRDILDKQKRILDLEAAIVTYKTDQTNLNEVIKHRDDLTSKFNRIMEINYNLNEDISKLNSSYSEQLNILQEKVNILQTANNNLKATIQNNENEINQQKSSLNDNKVEMERMRIEINSQATKRLYETTTNDFNRILQETIKAIFDFNGKIISEINEFGDYMIKQADKNMTAQHYIRKLMKSLYDKEQELKEARKYIDYNKYVETQPLYYPLKEDNIDVKLGELINDYPSRSRIKSNFIRESRGNYKYGPRKIQVSIENNKLFIKTGSNIITFDDFIDKFGAESITNDLKENKYNAKKNSTQAVNRSVSPNIK